MAPRADRLPQASGPRGRRFESCPSLAPEGSRRSVNSCWKRRNAGSFQARQGDRHSRGAPDSTGDTHPDPPPPGVNGWASRAARNSTTVPGGVCVDAFSRGSASSQTSSTRSRRIAPVRSGSSRRAVAARSWRPARGVGTSCETVESSVRSGTPRSCRPWRRAARAPWAAATRHDGTQAEARDSVIKKPSRHVWQMARSSGTRCRIAGHCAPRFAANTRPAKHGDRACALQWSQSARHAAALGTLVGPSWHRRADRRASRRTRSTSSIEQLTKDHTVAAGNACRDSLRQQTRAGPSHRTCSGGSADRGDPARDWTQQICRIASAPRARVRSVTLAGLAM
jgi:hypothetical protein